MSITAPLSNPGGDPVARRPDEEQTFVQDSTEGHPDPMATKPKPPGQGITATEGRPLRRPERHIYSDPCNYLG